MKRRKRKEEQINSEPEPMTQKLALFLRPCQCSRFSTVEGVGVSGLLPLSHEVVGTCTWRFKKSPDSLHLLIPILAQKRPETL